MEEQTKEKDKFWLYVGAIIAAVVVLVFLFKGREMESISPAYEQLQQETAEQIKKY
ncbi:MAG: hypothetical protein ABFS02_11440 [Pseudomonadota bacterium]